jgi:hypothetical protein
LTKCQGGLLPEQLSAAQWIDALPMAHRVLSRMADIVWYDTVANDAPLATIHDAMPFAIQLETGLP